jgi:putative aldouronate transport system permease protein
MQSVTKSARRSTLPLHGRMRAILRNYELYLFLLPTALYFAIFHYGPMYGVQIAFREFNAIGGITGSPWVGLEHFQRFVRSFQFVNLLRNTLFLSLYQLAASFPIPILLALLLNHVRRARFKRLVQTVTYAPHFISVVVLVGMLHVFLSPSSGLVNHAIRALGGEPIMFMARARWFRHVYVWSTVWQHSGWATIIYLAALAAIPPDLHEAAIVDGATIFQRIRHVDIPGIMPTVVILLILNVGRLMQLGFEKAFLMQSPLNLETSEIIQTYVYKVGLLGAQYSFSAAVGLFNAVINLVLLLTVNRLAKSLGQSGLF